MQLPMDLFYFGCGKIQWNQLIMVRIMVERKICFTTPRDLGRTKWQEKFTRFCTLKKKLNRNISCTHFRHGYDGFPGWHLECTAMRHWEYLGNWFWLFMSMEWICIPASWMWNCSKCEACTGQTPVNYWMHANIHWNGKKWPTYQ
jgi:hypothetical protein